MWLEVFFYLQMSLDVAIIVFASQCVLELLWHDVDHTSLIESHVLQVVQDSAFSCAVCVVGAIVYHTTLQYQCRLSWLQGLIIVIPFLVD